MSDWAILFAIIGIGCIVLMFGAWFGDWWDEEERRDARRRNGR